MMREYKLVFLNKGLSATKEKDFQKAEDKINEMTAQGWILQQIVTPSDMSGTLLGVFYMEKKL